MNALVPLIPVAGAAVAMSGVWWLPEIRVRFQRPNEVALAVAELLERCPDEWERDGRYYIHHKSGVAVWIANKAYALEVKTPNGTACGFDQCLGGNASQRHVWKAYLRWAEAHPIPDKPREAVIAALEGCRSHTA